MSGDHPSLDGLLQSPFDPLPSESSGGPGQAWWPIVAGVAIGALAVLAGYLLTSGDSSAAATTSTSTTTTSTTSGPTTTVAPAETPVAFPAGFVEVTEMIGIKPEYIIDAGDQLVVAFTSATRRGFESTEGFDGGDWILETSAGEELTASGITTSVAVPGGFSVQFPKEGEVVPQRMRLVTRWEIDRREGRLEIPFTGVPFEVGGNSIDLGAGIAVSLDRITLSEFDGEVEWSLAGAGERGGGVDLVITVGSELSPTAVYFPRVGGFNFFGGGAALDDIATEGTLPLTRQDQDGTREDTVSIEVFVTLVGTLPADAVFDLADVPGLDR